MSTGQMNLKNIYYNLYLINIYKYFDAFSKKADGLEFWDFELIFYLLIFLSFPVFFNKKIGNERTFALNVQ